MCPTLTASSSCYVMRKNLLNLLAPPPQKHILATKAAIKPRTSPLNIKARPKLRKPVQHVKFEEPLEHDDMEGEKSKKPLEDNSKFPSHDILEVQSHK